MTIRPDLPLRRDPAEPTQGDTVALLIGFALGVALIVYLLATWPASGQTRRRPTLPPVTPTTNAGDYVQIQIDRSTLAMRGPLRVVASWDAPDQNDAATVSDQRAPVSSLVGPGDHVSTTQDYDAAATCELARMMDVEIPQFTGTGASPYFVAWQVRRLIVRVYEGRGDWLIAQWAVPVRFTDDDFRRLNLPSDAPVGRRRVTR